MSETALSIVDGEVTSIERPGVLMDRATSVAAVCKAVVLKLAVEIQGKRYLPVEAWATIASAYGCVPSIREVVEEERGIRAVAELKRADGSVIATAEGYVGLDEPTWANRPMYARRAMAQTRSISRVCRSAFAFVVSLMDAGLSTTPVEEISHAGEPSGAQPSAPKPEAKPGKSEPIRSPDTKCRFGRSKGKYLCDIDDLDWQLAAARKSVEAGDPKWGAANQKWLATVEAEVERRKS